MFYNSSTGVLCIIHEDKSYALAGGTPEAHDAVTDEELWDMADGYAPDGWETVQKATPGSIQDNLVRAYGGAVG
jgi:hypothetical protein